MTIRPFTILLYAALMAATPAAGNELDEAMEGYQTLRGERRGPVTVVRLYNPPTNLMTAAMVAELDDLIDRVAADESTRVLVLTGGVPGYFIQHYDVAELDRAASLLAENPDAFPGPELHATHQAYRKIEKLPKPVIAAINGQAHGGGFELALVCDFRLLSRPGSVGLPEANVGILPGAGGNVRLPRLIGAAKAKELMMLGQVVDAETAERLGMVTRAVPAERLMAETMALAERLASLPPQAVGLIKQVVDGTRDLPIEEALRFEEERFWRLMRSEEARRLMREYVEADQQGLEPR